MCTRGVIWESERGGFESNMPEYYPYGSTPAGNDPIQARALSTCMRNSYEPSEPARGSLYTKLYTAENFLSHSSPRRGTNIYNTPKHAHSPATVQDIENGEDMVVESNVAHQTIEGPSNPVVYRNQNKRGREFIQSPSHEFMGEYNVKRQRMVQPQIDSSMNVQVPSSNQAFFRNTTGWF